MSAELQRNATSRWQCVVFDLDGTLLDTRPALLLAINRLLTRLHRSGVSVADLADATHEGIESMLTRALELTGPLPSREKRIELHDELARDYLRSAGMRVDPYPGLSCLLDSLQRAQVRMAVCTNQLEVHARELLQTFALAPYFSDVVGRDTLGVSKPSPLPLVWLLGRCGVHPRTALFVGDSDVDARCATSAGVEFMLMRHGYGNSQAFAAYASCQDFAELHQFMHDL